MFQRIVLDLIESGLSEQEIAQAVGTSQPSINRIKLGKQGKSGVKYELGVKLVELHRAKVIGGPSCQRRSPPVPPGRGAGKAVSNAGAANAGSPSAATASAAKAIDVILDGAAVAV